MDIKLSNANIQGIQAVLDEDSEQLEKFINNPHIKYYTVKALICFMLSEHENSKS